MQSIPEIGTMLADRYYIEDILDTCGETAILKCIDTRLETVCAIKLLIGDDEAPDWQQRREFFADAFRKQARLNHPNIVHVVNIELRGVRTFAVMEAVEGFPLARYLETAVLSPKEVTELFLSITDAVSMAHASNILHKSISPRNIMLYQQDNRLAPRILNFGTHRDSKCLDPMTQLAFLAPEQLDDFEKAMPASDVYALCASMYFAFTGQSPYFCDDYARYRAMINSGKLKLELPPQIPPEFSGLIKTGLSVQPHQRFPNASALLKSLKKIGAGFQLSANLTIEASKSCSNWTPVAQASNHTPSQPIAMRPSTGSYNSASGGFAAVAPVSNHTPSQPIAVRPPTGPYNSPAGGNSAAATVSNHTPSQPIIVRPPTGSYNSPSNGSDASAPISNMTPSQPIVVRASTGSYKPSPQIAKPQSSNSQSIVAPGSEVFAASGGQQAIQPIPEDCQLAGELAQVYRIERVDSIRPHAFVGAVSSLEQPDVFYAFKMLRSNDELEKAVFAEGVRRTDILSRECPYFEKILENYPEYGFCIMHDVSRISLVDSLKNDGAFSVMRTLHIGILLAIAMNEAHQHGFVNGNIKPSNIIFEELDGSLTPVFYDFGQKLYVSDASQLSVGDIPYIAPELGYNLQNSNAQADIYAFGMIPIEMLIGRSVYLSGDRDSLIAEIQACNQVPNTGNWQEEMPKKLVKVLQWCTSFDPSQRYVHFTNVIHDLSYVYQYMKE